MMTDAGRGIKIKNVFVEQYDPLYMSGDCRWIMKEETKPGDSGVHIAGNKF